MTDIDSAVLDAKRRANSYDDIDGLPLLGWSILCFLMCSVYIWQLRTRTPHVGGIVAVVWGAWGLVVGALVRWLKSRITYPRTGFVVVPQKDPNETPAEAGRRSVKLLVLFMIFLFGILFYNYASDRVSNHWIDLVVLTACFTLAGRVMSSGQPFNPGLWLFLSSFLSSLWLGELIAWALARGRNEAGVYVWFLWGLFSLLWGATQLVRYVKQHRASRA